MEKSVIILGAGGHAVVIADIVQKNGIHVLGFLDDALAVGTEIFNASVLGKISTCTDYKDCAFVIGIGDNPIREQLAGNFDLPYHTFVHPSAVISPKTVIGKGTVIMAGCIVNPRTTIGKHCIVNTRASLDHDNVLGNFVHISPGAALGGMVTVGDGTHVGIGSCVKNNISICNGVKIGAGAAVVKDISESGVYAGVPAKRVK